MGRKKKPKGYSILAADAVCCVGEDRVYNADAESDPEKSLMDKLQCPVADEVLIALRKAFSLTFPRNPFLEGIKAELAEIRRLGVEALKPMPEVLSDLGLAPIPAMENDPAITRARVFRFVFARTEEVDISVKADGKRRRLLDLVGNDDGTELVKALRSVVSDTFEEAHNEDQLMAILRRIRERIQKTLPAFNACLESIEIEPIAGTSN